MGGTLSRPETLGVATGVFLLLGLAWWGATALALVKPIFLPAPGSVLRQLASLAQDGTLLGDLEASLYRILVGFLIASALAIPTGVVIGTFKIWEAAIEPLVDFIRYMPVVAFVPLSILWTGTGDAQKFLIIFIGTFFQQVLMVMDNVKRVPSDFIGLGRTLGLPDRQILTRIVVPSALPGIWDTLRISIGWAWTWLVLAELVAATSGLGLPDHRLPALFPDQHDHRLHPAARAAGPRHRPDDEGRGHADLPLQPPRPMTAAKLAIRGLSKSFVSGRTRHLVLRDIDLDLADAEFVSLVGTSGCGKSTLLSIVSGLQDFDAGTLTIDGSPVSGPGLDRGVVFQSYTLLPWLTARQNVEFALRAAHYDPASCRRIALDHLDLVRLGAAADRFPSELSGGMKQRVAIARALSYRPKMLLMDEPFGALDALTRHEMQDLLTEVWEQHRLTVLFVTHDVEEAVYLSDRIEVMGIGPGRLTRSFAIPLSRPRRQEMIETREFIELQKDVLRAIREASRPSADGSRP